MRDLQREVTQHDPATGAAHVRRGSPVPSPVGESRTGDRTRRNRPPRRHRCLTRQYGGARRQRVFPTVSLIRFTAYGRNLLGEVFRRSHFDLTCLVDSTYSPLKEGRVLGMEARWEFQ